VKSELYLPDEVGICSIDRGSTTRVDLSKISGFWTLLLYLGTGMDMIFVTATKSSPITTFIKHNIKRAIMGKTWCMPHTHWYQTRWHSIEVIDAMPMPCPCRLILSGAWPKFHTYWLWRSKSLSRSLHWVDNAYIRSLAKSYTAQSWNMTFFDHMTFTLTHKMNGDVRIDK